MDNEWKLNQANRIGFVMVDSNGNEVAGLVLAGTISKNAGAAVACVGIFTEVAGMTGRYSYLSTAGEADTIGTVDIEIPAIGTAVQQNLVYTVQQRNAGCVPYTYTVTDSVTTNPIDGVEIWITTDLAGNNIIWNGVTDALGIAKDSNDNLPCLDAGTYYFWKQLGGFVDDDNPDLETVN